MSKKTFTLNRSGVREILNCSQMQAACLKPASRMCKAAQSMSSGEFEADVQAGRNRCHAMVKTMDWQAAHDNAEHNVLLKAFGA